MVIWMDGFNSFLGALSPPTNPIVWFMMQIGVAMDFLLVIEIIGGSCRRIIKLACGIHVPI
jgi:hypothetical protein